VQTVVCNQCCYYDGKECTYTEPYSYPDRIDKITGNKIKGYTEYHSPSYNGWYPHGSIEYTYNKHLYYNTNNDCKYFRKIGNRIKIRNEIIPLEIKVIIKTVLIMSVIMIIGLSAGLIMNLVLRYLCRL